MRHKHKSRSDYNRLKRKLLIRFAVTAGIAYTLLAVLYSFAWRGYIGNTIVRILNDIFRMNYNDALKWYQLYIRNNIEVIFGAAVLVTFFILSRVVLNWFTGYFDMINGGVSALLDETESIRLPDEMMETERKLNSVKEELRRRDQERQAAENRKNDLVMYLAHDIRTPLTSVIGYLHLLNEKAGISSEKKVEYAAVALDKAYRLEKMINEFFDLTRFNAQEIRIHREKIDLYYLLMQLTDEMLPVFAMNQNTVHLTADENLTVYGDPEKLARAFNNILKNAASYSDRGTQILVIAEAVNDTIRLSFTNRGNTLSRYDLDIIFDKFSRLDSSRQSSTGGTGLGLAIAKEIIELHEGRIEAESHDHTVTIKIYLPIECS